MGYVLDFGAVLRGLDNLLWGLAVGLAMGLAGLAAGSLIGLVAAWGAIRGGRVVRVAVGAYVGLIRNVPILVLALFAFFALPQYGIRFSNTTTFAVVLAVYAGAYLTESFRAAILVIPKATVEAAQSIGLTGAGRGAVGGAADRAPQCAAEPRQQFHLAVQGHLDRGRHRRARADLPGAQDQQ